MAVKGSAAVDCGLVLGVVKIVRPVGRCTAVTMTMTGTESVPSGGLGSENWLIG